MDNKDSAAKKNLIYVPIKGKMTLIVIAVPTLSVLLKKALNGP